MSCQNNLKQFGLALQNYHDSQGSFPSGIVYNEWWTFRALFLPYIEESAMHDQIDFTHGGRIGDSCYEYLNSLVASNRSSPAQAILDIVICPSDALGDLTYDDRNQPDGFSGDFGNHTLTSYLGVSGIERPNPGVLPVRFNWTGILYTDSGVTMRQILDGTSKTLIVGERGLPDDLGWGWNLCAIGLGDGERDATLGTLFGLFPRDNASNAASLNLDHYYSYHPGGTNFLVADGSVQSLSYDIEDAVFKAMSTRAGGLRDTRGIEIVEPAYSF